MSGAWPTHPAADLFPLLDDLAIADLAGDIHEHGLREPVWLWDDPERGTVVLDGRNRVKACELAGVPVRTRTYDGDDPWPFVWSLNSTRRHLTTGQLAFARLKLEAHYATEAKERERVRKMTAGDATSADLRESPEPQRERRSDERAARGAPVSGRAVAQAKRVQQAAPDLAEKVQQGAIALDRAERIIRDREAEARRVERAKREAAAAATATRADIRHGDFRQALDDLDGVDAVITDPPYAFEYLPLLDDLAAWADKVLAPDGVLAVLIGNMWLPEVYRRLDGHRPYRWTCCYLTPGVGYQAHARGVQSNWKPLLVYGGGRSFGDIIRSERQDAGAKDNHRWGQDYAAFHTLIERMTEAGQTIADPFMGSGTTLLAAHALGRHVIGCDIDAESVAKARERLA